MSETPDVEQSSALAAPVAAGLNTVINPERRREALAVTGTTSASVTASGDSSDIWNRLFRVEADSSDAESVRSPADIELGHFVIEERIGIGGMGAVFRAVDQRLQRVVALKVLSPEQSRDRGSVQRFQNEGRAAARLDHDNIARVYFIGEDAGLHFIAFEFVGGTNILDLIRQSGRIDPADAVNYTLQISSALKHASAAGVVHRDIKPSNVIITPASRAKLVDLGLARKQDSESATDLTLAGTTLGTFDYISPEQAKDPRNVDVRSDIYSLGCTLYHMLTGEPPYPEGTVLQKLLDHQGKDPPDPVKKNRHVSEDLSAIVRKMMASDPRRRYSNPDQLIRDLMLVAGVMGLRGVSPEGLVWLTSRNARAQIWERHLGWMATVAVLLLIVVVLNSFPNIGRNLQQLNESGGFATAAQDEIPIAARSQPSPGSVVADGDSPPFANSQAGHLDSATEAVQGGGQGSVDTPHRPQGGLAAESSSLPERFNASAVPADNVFAEDSRSILGDPKISPVGPLGEESTTSSTSPPGVDIREANAGGESRTENSVDSVVVLHTPADTTSTAAPVVAAIDERQPFELLDADGALLRKYRSLEAACSEAEDGSTVLLNFNGTRRENPLRITNKNITLRANRGFRPVIEFLPERVPADGFPPSMITVTDGPVNLNNLNFVLTIPAEVDAGHQLALISIERPKQVRLHGVTVTVNSRSQCQSAVISLNPDSGTMLSEMKTITEGAASESTVCELTECIVRGHSDLFFVRQATRGLIAVEDTVIALAGSLMRVAVEGVLENQTENARLELELEHISCLLDGNVLEVDSSQVSPRDLPSLWVSARNNIFSSRSNRPLVVMNGDTDIDSIRQLLQWDGEKNYYDRYQYFWSFGPNEAPLDFEKWRLFWGAEREVGANNQEILWQAAWPQEFDYSRILARDLSLTPDQDAAGGATDGNDAGADLSNLPQIPQ